jgi:hypothetical protein
MQVGLLHGCLCAALVAAAAYGDRPRPPHVAPVDPDEKRLLEQRTIKIPIEGCVTGSFAKAYAVLQETNLLISVQQAYAAQLPPGEKPEFEVHSEVPGHYYYVNKDDERCDIRELWRQTDSNQWFEVAFHVRGERTFGPFESLIYLTLARESAATPDVLHYTADIRAWPHAMWARFLLRVLPGVECYFRMKTAEMQSLVTRIFARLVAS